MKTTAVRYTCDAPDCDKVVEFAAPMALGAGLGGGGALMPPAASPPPPEGWNEFTMRAGAVKEHPLGEQYRPPPMAGTEPAALVHACSIECAGKMAAEAVREAEAAA